jgi:predicted Rossmann fold flavoprotein
MTQNNADIIIVGAGASGLLAALECARAGFGVIVLEKEILAGRKILVTGNGRCNFSNQKAGVATYFGDKDFVKAALDKFSPKDCVAFFEDLGMLAVCEEGRYFPVTGKASSVAGSLVCAAQEAGAQFVFKEEVTEVKNTNGGYRARCADGQIFTAKNIILSCGSLAYPQAGGTESGYNLAKSLGHKINPLSPALCALNIKEAALGRLAGLKVLAKVTLADGAGNVIDAEEGEIIFGAKGVSGNNILSISRNAAAGHKIFIDFLPQFTAQEFDAFMTARAQKMQNRKVKDFFEGLLADSATNLLVDYLGVKKNILVSELKQDIFARIVKTIKAWPFTVEGLRPWKEASAAKGGVDTAQVQAGTFESKLSRGVYITGELLDIDGRCGGFNLHFAWASGFCAARAIKEQACGKSDNKKN